MLGGGYLKAYTLSPPHQLVNSGPAPTARTVDVAADGSIWMGSSDPASGAPSLTRLNATTGAVLQQLSITHLASVRASKAARAGSGYTFACLRSPGLCELQLEELKAMRCPRLQRIAVSPVTGDLFYSSP